MSRSLPRNLGIPTRFPFRGRSLAFVRTVLGLSAPLASSAWSYAFGHYDQLTRSPEVGMVCFWGTHEPGDCGVYLGDGFVLCLSPQGVPTVRLLSEVARTNFLGAMRIPVAPTRGRQS